MKIAKQVETRVDKFTESVRKFIENPSLNSAETVCVTSRNAWATLYRQALVSGGYQISEELIRFQKAIDESLGGLKLLEPSNFKSAYNSELETRQKLSDSLRNREFDTIRVTLSKRAGVELNL